VIVLDTNVLSEPMRRKPDPLVVAWLTVEERPLYTTAVSVGELLTGVRNLPSGKRRTGLLETIETTLSVFSDRILPYDEPAARTYAEMQASRRATGAPLSVEDGMIAAICRGHGAELATRNMKDFADLGISLLNPWDDRATL
jgi:toxin FitB